METIHSIEWWKALLEKSKLTQIVSITEMNCCDDSWNDWLATDNPYAISDRPSMEAGAWKFMNMICVIFTTDLGILRKSEAFITNASPFLGLQKSLGYYVSALADIINTNLKTF